MKKLLLAVLALATTGAELRAQDSVTNVHYQIALPQGDTKDYIDRTSFRGFGVDFRRFVGRDERISVGGGIGWNVFDSGAIAETIPIRTEEINGAVSGTQFRYINAIPLMAQFHYYFGDPDRTHAYVGTGAGVFWIEQRFEVGLLASQVSNWHFGVVPEAGINVPFADYASFNANVRYNFAAGSGQNVSGESASHQYLSFHLGFAFYSDLF